MSNPITVSTPSASERDAWEQLYRGYADFYQVPMDSTILSNVWTWLHDETTPFYCLVARDEGKLVGLMHYRPMPSPLRGAMVGFLDDLFVDPAIRGGGVVDALFDALDKERQARGWPLIRWITADNNYRARAVYDKLATRTHWVMYQLDE